MTVLLKVIAIFSVFSASFAAITDTYTPACASYTDPPPNGWKRWSNPATWSGGSIPGTNGNFVNATIPCNTGIILDVNITLDQIVVLGWLRVQDAGPFQVTANFVIVKGKLNIGTEASPYTGKITFNLTNGGYSYNFDTNTVGIKAFAMIGGSVELNGMYGNQAAWTTITKTAKAGATMLSVNGDVSKWPVNAAIAISSTDYDYKQAEQKTITSVKTVNGVTTIGLSSPLTYMHWGDPVPTGKPGLYGNESAEVTLLTRSIVIQGSPESNPLIGGHFIIFKTQTQQKITGVELTNMGQQGTLGRYPMHFHLSQDVAGSYVKKCSVHHTNQRCYVVHGTYNTLIDSNSAFNTKGHCYFLEDGIEYGNVFSNNLGFWTEAMVTEPTGSSASQSDSAPATFWISNPNNTWINNVAGGSVDSGYWFELAGNVLGPSAGFPGASTVYPHFVPLKLFQNNCGHSNSRTGLRTYSDGMRPRQSGGVSGTGGPINAPAQNVVLKDCRMYKNAFIGMFIHVSDSLIIDGGFFADNRVDALELHQVEHIIVQNAVIVGETANVGNPRGCDQASNAYATCAPLVGCNLPVDPSQARSAGNGNTPRTSPIFGILLDQSQFPSNGLTALGHSNGSPLPQHIYNVTFGLFDNTCKVAAAITANGKGVNALFSASHSSRGLTFDSITPRVYMAPNPLGLLGFESQADAGPTVSSYVFRDQDGTLIGGNGGYVVANTPALLSYSGCKALSGNYGWACKNTCYRTVAFTFTGTSSTPSFTVTRTLDNVSSVIGGFLPTTFLNLQSGITYDITISPAPSSVQVWFADPEGCSGSVIFRLRAASGSSWITQGASLLSCSGSALDPANYFQAMTACFNGVTPELQVIMGGMSSATLNISQTTGTPSCLSMQCGLVGADTLWNYNDNGAHLQSPQWSQTFNAGWKVGRGVLGYGGGQTTTIATTSAMNSVTWYFEKQFAFASSSCLNSVDLGIIVNDGVVVYMNGQEIYRNNLPAGSITYSTLALSSLGSWYDPAYTLASLPISNAKLANGVNTLAVEVHASSQYAWNARFDMYMSASGSSCGASKTAHIFTTKGLPAEAFTLVAAKGGVLKRGRKNLVLQP